MTFNLTKPAGCSGRRENSVHRSKCRSYLSVLISAMFTAGVLSSAGTAAATDRPASASAPGVCRASQLTVSFGHSSGAAGTVATGIQVRNLSKTSCELDGYPDVDFFSSRAVPGRTKVIVVHYGQGQLFSQRPRVVSLGKGGFVLESSDVNSSDVGCAQFSMVRFSLPGVAHIYTVILPYPQNVCGMHPKVGVSAFSPWAAIQEYVG
jgi:hypothetical protein